MEQSVARTTVSESPLQAALLVPGAQNVGMSDENQLGPAIKSAAVSFLEAQPPSTRVELEQQLTSSSDGAAPCPALRCALGRAG